MKSSRSRYLILSVRWTYVVLAILLWPDSIAFAGSDVIFPTAINEGSTFQRLITGRFGRFAMGILGLFGLGCLMLGAGSTADGQGGEREKNEMRLLLGGISLAISLGMFLYRIRVWRDTLATSGH